jgi:hypothetical protein
MAQDDKLVGARNAFSLYFAFMSDVAGEIGLQRAVDLSDARDELTGTQRGRMIKQETGTAEFDIKAAAKATRDSIYQDFGITSKVVDETPKSVVVQCGRCPVYEGASMAGFDHDSIGTQCCAGAIRYVDALVKELNPDLSYELRKFRTSGEGFCEEAIVMR